MCGRIMVLLIIIAIAVIAFVALIIKSSDVQTLSPEKVAGKRGEAAAANIIRSVLRKGYTVIYDYTISLFHRHSIILHQ